MFETKIHVTPTASYTLTVADGKARGHVPAEETFGNWSRGDGKLSVDGQQLDPSPDEVRMAAMKAIDPSLDIELSLPAFPQIEGFDIVFLFEPVNGSQEKLTAFCERAQQMGNSDNQELPLNDQSAPPGQGLEQMPGFMRRDDAFDINPSFLRQLNNAEAECKDAERQVDLAKEELKEAKDHYDVSVHRLRKLCSSQPADMPLFDQAAAPAELATPGLDPVAETWRVVPLREALLNVTDALFDKLKAAEIETVGQLADYSAAQGKAGHTAPLTTIAGIGPMKAEMIQKALDEFWERRKS